MTDFWIGRLYLNYQVLCDANKILRWNKHSSKYEGETFRVLLKCVRMIDFDTRWFSLMDKKWKRSEREIRKKSETQWRLWANKKFILNEIFIKVASYWETIANIYQLTKRLLVFKSLFIYFVFIIRNIIFSQLIFPPKDIKINLKLLT